MSIWQSVFVLGWVAAVLFGKPDWRIALIVAANFATTYMFPNIIGIVGVTDLLCFLALLHMGIRAQIIGAIYLIMAVINAIGHLSAWPLSTTYAILDPLGWLMLAVLGGADHGLGKIYHTHCNSIRRWIGDLRSTSHGVFSRSMGAYHKNNGGLNGRE